MRVSSNAFLILGKSVIHKMSNYSFFLQVHQCFQLLHRCSFEYFDINLTQHSFNSLKTVKKKLPNQKTDWLLWWHMHTCTHARTHTHTHTHTHTILRGRHLSPVSSLVSSSTFLSCRHEANLACPFPLWSLMRTLATLYFSLGDVLCFHFYSEYDQHIFFTASISFQLLLGVRCVFLFSHMFVLITQFWFLSCCCCCIWVCVCVCVWAQIPSIHPSSPLGTCSRLCECINIISPPASALLRTDYERWCWVTRRWSLSRP